MSDYKIQKVNYKNLDKKTKIVLIVSEFNRELTKKLEEINEKFLKDNGFLKIEKYLVPWALEIPAFMKLVKEKQKPDLIICLWAIIRWETTHYEIVCNESARWVMTLSVKWWKSIAVINWILTCENEKQVKERISDAYAKSGLNLLLERQKV